MKLKIEESGTKFNELLRQKENVLRKEINDPEQLTLLFTQNVSSSANFETNLQSLNISSLGITILHAFKDDDEVIRREINDIISAHKTYADIAVKALETVEFDDVSSDLKANLKFISKFLLKKQKETIHKIIEECRYTESQSCPLKECTDKLKSDGIKSLADVYEG